ncbi:hypothetical protein KBD81_00440, partial [Candidatus Woesebacteria bacterium]|nr:hypothetical protein [Candidatus Woesebacteria bacterium]
MSKYVPDITSQKWVIITSQRDSRPDDNHSSRDVDVDPFAPGNEAMTPQEVFRIGKGKPDAPGWEVRVIPNKFPISDFHEVIIHAPENGEMQKLSTEHAVKVFQAYRERFNYYHQMGQVIIFCNQGADGGASLSHPHSQLVVLPHQINIDTLVREPVKNVIAENDEFQAYCPDYSEWPYEIWIAPKKEDSIFGTVSDSELAALIPLVQSSLLKLEQISVKKHPEEEFSYNYYISPKENWFLRIIPRMTSIAGFELCTGLSVNVIDPDEAARELVIHEINGKKDQG